MVIAKKEAFEKYVHTESEAIRRQYAALVSELKSKAQQYLDAIHDTLEDWGIVAYLPPESRDALIALIDTAMSNREVAADFLYRDNAAFIVAEILVTQQTPRQPVGAARIEAGASRIANELLRPHRKLQSQPQVD